MEENENMVCDSSQAVDVKYEVVDLSSDEKKECFFCNKCNLNLTSFEALEDHFRCFHVVEKRLECFFCASCRKEYMSFDTLMKHLRREHTLETIDACDYCGVKLPFCYTLPTHYRLIKSNKNFCDACKKHLETKSKGKGVEEDLENFLGPQKKISIEKDSWKQPENRIVLAELNSSCNDFFQKSTTSLTAVPHHPDLPPYSQSTVCGKKDLQSVYGVIHGRKDPFLCKICELSFSLFDALEDHLRGTHIAESIRKKFFCRICSKEFNVIEGLMVHLLRDHTSGTNPVCGNCGTKFLFPRSTSTHEFTKPMELYCLPCLIQHPELATEFASESSLTNHTVKSNQSNDNFYNICSKHEKPYSCDICNQKYRYRRSLTNHRCKNNNEKDSSANVSEYENNKLCDDIPEKEPFSCEKCGKQFLNKKKLDDHSRIHVLRHHCEICEKSFYKKSRLREHLLVHTGEKPYSCDICGQKFSLRRYLTKHYHKHSDQTDVCNICPKENPDLLCEHRPKNTEEPCACEKCGKQFLNKQKLDVHSRTHIRRHRCEICEKTFYYKCDLRYHRLVHTGEKPYSCDICGQKYRLRKSLANHRCKNSNEKISSANVSEEHKNNELNYDNTKQVDEEPCYCEKCDKQFPNKKKLVAHSKIHILNHRCEICGKMFYWESKLRDHRLVHTGEKPFSCDICGRKYSLRRYLTKHYREHSDKKDVSDVCSTQNPDGVLCERRAKNTEEPCACEKCGKKFPSKGKLAQHSRTHVLKHRCEICEKAFCSKSKLREHCLTHTGERPYCCDFCSAKFVCKTSLSRHTRKHTMQNERTPSDSVAHPLLPCDLCNKVFSCKYSLRDHRLLHTGEKPYACHICDKKFVRRKFLTQHYHKHAGDRHVCEVCNKGFSSITYLREYHSRTHTGEKPYSCIACGGKFPTMAQLKIHSRIHTGERPFECETCEKKFTGREDLKKHVRVHTGEKPYVCDFCGRGFTQKWVMVAHRRIHTGERPFKCEVCQRGFIYKSQMKTHQLTHFKDKPVV